MEIVFKLYYSTNNRWEKDRFRYWIERIRPLRFYTLFFSFLFFRQRTRKIDYLAGGWWWFRCEDVKLKGDGNCEFKLYYSSNNRWEKDRYRYWMGRSSIGEEFWQENKLENRWSYSSSPLTTNFSSSNLLVDRRTNAQLSSNINGNSVGENRCEKFLEKYRENIPIFRENKLPSGSNYSALKKIDQTLPLTCLN